MDCDLKSFFDTVNHGLLMNRLARRMNDPQVLRLIGRYLHTGVILPDGSREATTRGVPQGGPLSPLLANIMLDDLDKELETRGLRFARYADDFLIFVRTRSAAERVLRKISRFVEGRLALGIDKDEVKLASRSRKGYWRMAGNSIVQRALTKPWLWDQGGPNMRQQWVDLHYPAPSGAA